MRSNPDEQIRLVDVHMDLERDIADFFETESSILYSQGFSTIPCVIPALAKRGDIIVADRCINFDIQKGLQFPVTPFAGMIIMTSKVLRRVLLGVEKDGSMVDLPKLVSCARSERVRSLSYRKP